jgi:hypothetical protein
VFGALPQPLEVKEVGEGWLAHLAGPALLAVAAIFAAAIAAYVASRNHTEQLDHDRELRDREHIRDTIDAAFEAAHDLIRKVTVWENQIKFGEDKRTAYEEMAENATEEEAKTNAEEKLEEINRGLTKEGLDIMETEIATTVFLMRLRLRLGKDHRIVTEHDAFRKAIKAQRKCLERGEMRNRTTAEIDEAKRLDSASTQAAEVFLAACEEWFVTSEPRARPWAPLRLQPARRSKKAPTATATAPNDQM